MPRSCFLFFVADWQLTDPIPHGTRAEWTAEAKSLRPHHNLTPDTCVAATAIALLKAVLRENLDRFLATLPFFCGRVLVHPRH